MGISRMFCVVVLLALAFAGCGNGTTPTTNQGPVVEPAPPGNAKAFSAGTPQKIDMPLLNGAPPKLAKKPKYKVGFAQVESNNPWRIAQSESMKAEASARGYQIVYTDANGSEAKQIADIDSMIAQQVDAIFLAPRSEKPLAQAVLKAKAAGIPVILIDRSVDPKLAKANQDYVTFIGSDFVDEGKRAAEWLIKTTGGKAKIIELEGTVGSSPAIDRKKGFDDEIKKAADMQIVASQTADFSRDKGRQVMETLLQANPDVTAVYAHNDEMAIGAIAALESAGKKPGKDIIVVSIDGEKDALKAIIDGKLGATVECNPRFGPRAFDVLESYANNEPMPAKMVIPDKFYDKDNAEKSLAGAY